MIFGKKEAEDPQKASSAIQVTSQESGQKLMGFLERRLLLPPTLLHRWIRTGQVRLNGSRTQPFVRLATGDSVRIPPFAGALSKQAKAAREKQESRKPRCSPSVRPHGRRNRRQPSPDDLKSLPGMTNTWPSSSLPACPRSQAQGTWMP